MVKKVDNTRPLLIMSGLAFTIITFFIGYIIGGGGNIAGKKYLEGEMYNNVHANACDADDYCEANFIGSPGGMKAGRIDQGPFAGEAAFDVRYDEQYENWYVNAWTKTQFWETVYIDGLFYADSESHFQDDVILDSKLYIENMGQANPNDQNWFVCIDSEGALVKSLEPCN